MTEQERSASSAVVAVSPEVAEAYRALQRQDFASCEARCRETIARDPSHGDALHLLGLALSASGKPGEGVEFLKKACASSPTHGVYRFSLGRQLASMGEHRAAIDEFQVALQNAPKMAQAAFEIGRSRERLGDRAGALEAYHKAADARGDFAPAHFAMAGLLRQAGRKEDAVERYRQAVAAKPEYGEAHYNLGLLLRDLGRLEEAETALSRATELLPRLAAAWTGRGAVCASLHRNAEAESCFLHAIELSPDDITARTNLGNVLLLQNRPDAAIEHFEHVLRLNPDSAVAQLGAGLALRGQLRVKEAMAALERALTLDPKSVQTKYAIAEANDRIHQWDQAELWGRRVLESNADHRPSLLLIGRLERESGRLDDAERTLLPLLDGSPTEAKRVPVLKELGHIERARGRSDRAFERYQAAADILAVQPEVQSLLENPLGRSLATYPEHLSRSVVATWDEHPPADGHVAPIMLCGFPRSGLTLVEQMLGCVPGVATTDEAPLLSPVLGHVAQTAGAYRPYPDCLDDLLEDQVLECRAMYWEAAARLAHVPPGCGALIDKHMLSVLHLGLIRRIFPDARVLMVHRDPRDVVLDCFAGTFAINQATASFTSVRGAAELYDAYIGLWDFAKSTLGLQTLEIRYEDLIRDPRASMKDVLGWLGLPWTDAVLRHHEHVRGRALRSQSFREVAEPINARHIGGWRAFEGALGPAMPVIEGRVRQLGYE